MKTVFHTVSLYARLIRLRISLFAALSAAAGYIMESGAVWADISAVFSGVFLMAAGSGAMNQVLERKIDSLMARTMHRPVASGKIRVNNAAAFSIALLSGGACVLAQFGAAPVMLGVLASIWYNGPYVWLKRRVSSAFMAGALSGALPPMIGWSAAGGGIMQPRILFVAAFFYLWQAPHYMLILLRHGSDFKRASLPVLSDSVSDAGLRRIAFVWVLTAAVMAVMMPMFGAVRADGVSMAALGLSAGYMAWEGLRLMWAEGGGPPALRVSMFALIVTLIISVESLI